MNSRLGPISTCLVLFLGTVGCTAQDAIGETSTIPAAHAESDSVSSVVQVPVFNAGAPGSGSGVAEPVYEKVKEEVKGLSPLELAERVAAISEVSSRAAAQRLVTAFAFQTQLNMSGQRFVSPEFRRTAAEIEAEVATYGDCEKYRSDWMREVEIAAAARAEMERLRAEEGSGAKSLPNGATNP